MENPSHSFRRNQASATFSRKFYNGKGSGGFAAKTVYDDVFGGPTKFGVPTFSPRVEDYCEIFGSFNASRASSIPSLDLPVVDGPELSFDVRCSNFDYSEVFGGFGSLDFAVSYEELLERSKRGYDSSDAAWTPSESEYLSEESDPSACAAMSQFFSNGNSRRSFDEIMQFNDPYHKSNQAISKDMSKGVACTSHISSVSKITCVGDERSSFQKTEEKKTPLKVADDINIHMDVSRVMSGGKYFRKTKSLPPKNCSGPHTSGSDSKAQSGYCCDGAHPIETFVTVSDVSLTTCPSQVPPPSRPPPMLDFIKGDFTRLASNLEASTNFAFEGTPDERLPPFLNVEVDASSSTAAMKDVTSKAQAKLKCAEQIMDRKEVFQNPMNLGSRDDVEDLEGKVGNVVDGSKKLVDDKVQELGAVDDNEVSVFARKQTQVPIEMFDLDTDAIENEDLPAKVSANKKHEKDSEESYRTEGTGEWKEATEFYEIRTGLSRTAFEQVNNGNILVKKPKVHSCGEEAKIALEAFAQIEENDKAVVTKAGDWGKNEWTLGAGNEAREGNKIEDGTKEAESANSLQEHEKNDEVAKEDNEQKKQETMLNSAWEHDKHEEKLVKVDKKEHGNLIGMHETEVKNALMQMDGNQKLVQASSKIELDNEIDACRSGDVEKTLGETWKWEGNVKRLNKGFKQAEPEKRLLEKEENKKTLKAVPGWAENENKEKLNTEKGENEQMLKESLLQEENEKKEEILQSEEDEKRLEEAFEQEENGKKLKEAIIKEERENKKVHAHVMGDSEKRLQETCEGEKLEKRLQEAWGREEGEEKLQDIQGKKANEKKSTKAYEWDKIEKRSKRPDKPETNEKRLEESGEPIGLKSLLNVHGQSERDENEKKLKLAHKNSVPMEGRNLNVSDETSKLEDYTEVPCKHEVNNGKLGTNPVPCAHEGSGKIRVETKDGRTQLGAVKMAKKLSEEEFKAGMAEAYLEHGESQIRRKDAGKSTSNSKSFGSRQAQNRKANKTSVAFDSENLEKNSDQDGRGKSSSGAYLSHDQKNYENKPMTAHQVKEQVQIGRRTEAVESTVMQGRGNAQKIAQQVNMDHRKEKKITLTSEEREKEELMKREQELEKDRLRKMEEDIEREREREKDRMAVEIATREAREGTFVEARERAERAAVERANAEAKQRALVEARERLVKACAEAREKSVADKVSMEARLRVERAAVERATAEARERAVEKRMAEKAPYDTREKVERSFADTSFASSRDNGRTRSSSSSDLQSMGYSSGSRRPYPSGYGGVEGESAQRCRARLERHQRTAERAAKALAEKNMRDLLAQREQAERTRLAETLDAEVKRWSNGKEGNLRALLSTLQYILGTGSGWQPIPLTDVITSVAVKKAYRKATLFVHPDKLQQRGASVQQKYICEKVFDLLKEAWNKFNSEER